MHLFFKIYVKIYYAIKTIKNKYLISKNTIEEFNIFTKLGNQYSSANCWRVCLVFVDETCALQESRSLSKAVAPFRMPRLLLGESLNEVNQPFQKLLDRLNAIITQEKNLLNRRLNFTNRLLKRKSLWYW